MIILLRGGRSSAPLAPGGLPAYKLRQAVEFIEAHLDRPISLARLAAVVDLSPFHSHREFKRSAGLTPGKYISQIRIKRAKTLLSESDLPLAEVALQLGFADQSHFTAAFRRATSMTPRVYPNASAAT
jgi:AraC family transcriptional regulator